MRAQNYIEDLFWQQTARVTRQTVGTPFTKRLLRLQNKYDWDSISTPAVVREKSSDELPVVELQ
jgi:hypothetical protein